MIRFSIYTICAAALLLTLPARAQPLPCGDGAEMIAHLEKQWGEAPAVLALDAAGRLVRIMVNEETGSWTLLVTGPGQPTCLLSHGTAWEPIARPPEPGDPS